MIDDVPERMARGGFILTSGQIIAQLVTFAFSIIIARLLRPENYGLLTVAMTYPALLANISALGLEAAVARYVAEPSSKRSEYAWTALLIRLFAAIVAGLVTYFYADFFAGLLGRPEIAFLIRLLSLYTTFTSATGIIGATFSGLGKYRVSASMNIFYCTLRGPLALALVLIGLGLYGAILSHVIASIVVFSAYLVLYATLFKPFSFTHKALKDLLHLALPLYAASLLAMLVGPMINTVLSNRVPSCELGNYGVAINAQSPLGALLGGVSTAVLTSLPLLLGDRDLLKRSVIKTSFYVSAISTALGFCYASAIVPLVRLAYGRTYASAHIYALILAVSNVLPALLAFPVISNTFIALKSTKWNAVLGALQVILTATLAHILVPSYGVLGACVVLIAGNLVSCIIGITVLSRSFNLEVNLRNALKASTPALVAFFVSSPISYVLTELVTVYWLTTIYLYVLGMVMAIFISLAMYVVLYLILLPRFMDKQSIEILVELASRLEYVGKIVKHLGDYYLRLIG